MSDSNMKYLFYSGLAVGVVYVFRDSLGGITNLIGTAANTLDSAVTGVVSVTQNPNAGLTPDTFQLGKSVTSTRALATSAVAGIGTLITTKNVVYSLVAVGVTEGANVLYDYTTQPTAPASETTSGDILAPTGAISNTFNNIGNSIDNSTHKGFDGKDVPTFGARDDQFTLTPNIFGIVDGFNKISRLGTFTDKLEQASYQRVYDRDHPIDYYKYVDSEGHLNLCSASDSSCGADPKTTWMNPHNLLPLNKFESLVDWKHEGGAPTQWDNGIITRNGKKYHRIDIRCESQTNHGPYHNRGDPNKNCGVPTMTTFNGKKIMFKEKSDDQNWFKLFLEV